MVFEHEVPCTFQGDRLAAIHAVAHALLVVVVVPALVLELRSLQYQHQHQQCHLVLLLLPPHRSALLDGCAQLVHPQAVGQARVVAVPGHRQG